MCVCNLTTWNLKHRLILFSKMISGVCVCLSHSLCFARKEKGRKEKRKNKTKQNKTKQVLLGLLFLSSDDGSSITSIPQSHTPEIGVPSSCWVTWQNSALSSKHIYGPTGGFKCCSSSKTNSTAVSEVRAVLKSLLRLEWTC